MNALPATREPVSGGAQRSAAGTTIAMRNWSLECAITVITDFVGYSDAEIRSACMFIKYRPGVAPEIYKRAEMTLEAISQ